MLLYDIFIFLVKIFYLCMCYFYNQGEGEGTRVGGLVELRVHRINIGTEGVYL